MENIIGIVECLALHHNSASVFKPSSARAHAAAAHVFPYSVVASCSYGQLAWIHSALFTSYKAKGALDFALSNHSIGFPIGRG